MNRRQPPLPVSAAHRTAPPAVPLWRTSPARALALGVGAATLLAAVIAAAHGAAASTRAAEHASAAGQRAFLPWSAVNALRPNGGSVPTAMPSPTDVPPSPPPPSAIPTDEPTTAPTEAPTGAPSDVPTSEPTPTATTTPSPTAPPPLHCQELITNGDFEAGAKRWSLMVNGMREQAASAIQNATRLGFAPHSGTYAAWLGALDDSTMDLRSDALVNVDPARILSATLSAAVVIVTNGPRNRHADDTFAVVMEGTHGEVRPEPLRLNDESWNAPWKWHVRQADVTTLLQRDTFSRVRVRVETDAADATWFYFDDVSLNACTTDG
ncbi:MAG: hypothetical protein IPG72_05815 [Ardenticatenales bacterium]|nr:hypothetical protein [Ardenticatenales bacterium]